MTGLLRRIEDFWLAPGSARHLGWVRFIVGAWVAFGLIDRGHKFRQIARTDPARWRSVGVTSWMDGPISPEAFDVFFFATVVLAILFALGVGHRFLGGLFAVLLLFVYSYRQSWGMVYHTLNLEMVHVICLALAPASDRVSADYWLRTRFPEKTGWLVSDRPDVHWGYGWGIRLIILCTAITYFIAGVAKLAGPAGFAWMLGDNLRDQIATDALYKELLVGHQREHVYTIYEHGALLLPFTVATIALEIGAPAALAHRWLGYLWAVGTCGMHWGIMVLMGIGFNYPLYMFAFAALFPIHAWVDRLFSRLGRERPGWL